MLSSREDRGREAGCAGADDRYVVCRKGFRQTRKLMPKAAAARVKLDVRHKSLDMK